MSIATIHIRHTTTNGIYRNIGRLYDRLIKLDHVHCKAGGAQPLARVQSTLDETVGKTSSGIQPRRIGAHNWLVPCPPCQQRGKVQLAPRMNSLHLAAGHLQNLEPDFREQRTGSGFSRAHQPLTRDILLMRLDNLKYVS